MSVLAPGGARTRRLAIAAREHGAGERGGAVDGRHRGERGVHGDARPGVVDCLANTTTTNTTNTNGATNPSSDRVQEFNNGANITGTMAATVDGYGLQLSLTNAGPNTIDVINSGTVTTNQDRQCSGAQWQWRAGRLYRHRDGLDHRRRRQCAGHYKHPARAASRSSTTASSARPAITASSIVHAGGQHRRHHSHWIRHHQRRLRRHLRSGRRCRQHQYHQRRSYLRRNIAQRRHRHPDQLGRRQCAHCHREHRLRLRRHHRKHLRQRHDDGHHRRRGHRHPGGYQHLGDQRRHHDQCRT